MSEPIVYLRSPFLDGVRPTMLCLNHVVGHHVDVVDRVSVGGHVCHQCLTDMETLTLNLHTVVTVFS